MPRMDRIGKANTYKHIDGYGYTAIKYHDTDVVRYKRDMGREEVILNSGDWRTVTTKNRMNQASNEFDLGYRVFQLDSEWFVQTGRGTYTFHDNMVLTNGDLTGGGNQ